VVDPVGEIAPIKMTVFAAIVATSLYTPRGAIQNANPGWNRDSKYCARCQPRHRAEAAQKGEKGCPIHVELS
jgi:hypothetical protein